MYFWNKRMNNSTQTDWCVYDLETDTVVGRWTTYEAAEQFWADGLHAMDTHWAVFPGYEVAPTECGVWTRNEPSYAEGFFIRVL